MNWKRWGCLFSLLAIIFAPGIFYGIGVLGLLVLLIGYIWFVILGDSPAIGS